MNIDNPTGQSVEAEDSEGALNPDGDSLPFNEVESTGEEKAEVRS